VVLASCVTVWLVVLFVLATRSARVDHRNLRRCPRCHARAVRATGYREIDVLQAMVALQCGQCGVWRRLQVTRVEQRTHSRRVERDRRRIRRTMARLESERRSRDILTFVTVLRSDIGGAEDFLAMTCAPRAFARRPRYPRGEG
jgi:hypothetical protein